MNKHAISRIRINIRLLPTFRLCTLCNAFSFHHKEKKIQWVLPIYYTDGQGKKLKRTVTECRERAGNARLHSVNTCFLSRFAQNSVSEFQERFPIRI